MKGLCIADKNFEDIFSCVYEDISGLHWLFDESAFEYETSQETDFVDNKGWLACFDDLFPKYGKNVVEDWNYFYGFKPSATDLSIWSREFFNIKNRVEYISLFCEVYISNVDAFNWYIFTHNSKIIETVKRANSDAVECDFTSEIPGI